MGSKIYQGNTKIKDFEVFTEALQKIVKSGVASGCIKSSIGEKIKVDKKISENVGFIKQKDGLLKIITNEKVTPKENKLIKKIAANYNLLKAKKVLKEKGYKIKEELYGENKVLVGTLEVNDGEQKIGEQIIEVEAISPVQANKIIDEDENNIKIHSKNFEDSEKCKAAVDIISKEIEGEIIKDCDTAEYLSKSGKTSSTILGKSRASQTKKSASV